MIDSEWRHKKYTGRVGWNSSAGPGTAIKIRNSPEPERVFFKKKTMLKPGTTAERKILKPGTIPEPKILKNGT
jgi:hypothetical protein